MKLEYIISMANNRVRLRFVAMERSLRAVGCHLPLLVIPYDDDLFDLPKGATWWSIPKIIAWLDLEKARSVMRKYQALTMENYQFVDADVCFLKNPEDVLRNHSGFITSCGHWHNPAETLTEESRLLMREHTTIYQKSVFNTGQFACGTKLFNIDSLREMASRERFIQTCVRHKYHEQPGINLLVFASEVEVTNLTLPPYNMQSTWAGDYPDDFERYWSDVSHKPYLIHWAGTDMRVPRPINTIFYEFLTRAEKAEWDEKIKQANCVNRKRRTFLATLSRRAKAAYKGFNSCGN